MLVLELLAKKSMYGYEMIQTLKAASEDFFVLKEGTLYPILLRLEKLHYIRAEKRDSPLGPRRKYYQITAEGRVYLRDFYTEWSKLAKTIDKLFEGGVNDDR